MGAVRYSEEWQQSRIKGIHKPFEFNGSFG